MSTLGAQESCIFQHLTEVLREAFKNRAVFYLPLQKNSLRTVGCSLRNPLQVWALRQVSEAQVQPFHLASPLAICSLLDGSTALAPRPLRGTALQFWETACPHCSPALHTARLSSLGSFFNLKLLAKRLSKWQSKEETGV